MDDRYFEVRVKLTEAQIRAFEEFVAQAGFSDYRYFAASSAQAYDMLHAGERLRAALNICGEY
jgi:hypothetical protein